MKWPKILHFSYWEAFAWLRGSNIGLLFLIDLGVFWLSPLFIFYWLLYFFPFLLCISIFNYWQYTPWSFAGIRITSCRTAIITANTGCNLLIAAAGSWITRIYGTGIIIIAVYRVIGAAGIRITGVFSEWKYT